MTVGERIKEARKKAGLKQSELAEKLGVAVITIGQYERNQREPRIEQLQRIADALGINIVELIDPLALSYHQIIEAGKAGDKAFRRLDEAKRRGASQEELQQIEDEINRLYDARDEAGNENRMLRAFRKLNEAGQDKALERVEELAEIPKYQRTAPQVSPESPPPARQDTAPSSDAPETPPEDE